MAAILVVEDDDDLRELLSELLAAEGYSVRQTASGLEALLLAQRERFDVILLDVDVEDLSGAAVARVVVRDLDGAPIVVISGRTDEWGRDMLAAGVTACLGKPYSLERLLSLVRSILRAQSGREGAWQTDVRNLSRQDLEALADLSPEERDRLPFGAIAIDSDRRIVAYNAYEEEAASFWGPSVLGMRFEEVAPCFEVKAFAAQLERGLAGEPLDDVLRFVFPHHGAQCVVSVRLYRDSLHDRVWVFVSKRNGRD